MIMPSCIAYVSRGLAGDIVLAAPYFSCLRLFISWVESRKSASSLETSKATKLKGRKNTRE